MSNPSQHWSEQELTLLQETVGLTHQQSTELFHKRGYTNRGFDAVKKKRTQLGFSNDNKWSAEEIKVLENNYQTMTDQEIVDVFFPHRKFNQIAAKRLKLGLLKEAQWTPEDIEIVKQNYPNSVQSCVDLLPQYDRRAIKWLAGSLGLRTDLSKINRKYTHNNDYFTNLTMENCYVAGFIAADGSLRSRGKVLSIILHQQDRIILERFKQYFNYTGEVVDSIRQEKRKDGSTREGLKTTLVINGVGQWYTDLAKHFNIVPNKTKILQAPNLSSMDHKIAFVAGYTDGDGSIYTSGGKFYYSVLGTESVVKFIKKVFDTIVPIPENGKGRGSLVDLRGKYSFHLHKYTLSGKRAIAICQYIKQYPLPFLERKWSKVPTAS